VPIGEPDVYCLHVIWRFLRSGNDQDTLTIENDRLLHAARHRHVVVVDRMFVDLWTMDYAALIIPLDSSQMHLIRLLAAHMALVMHNACVLSERKDRNFPELRPFNDIRIEWPGTEHFALALLWFCIARPIIMTLGLTVRTYKFP
jgi:hypothetical protein